jgi:uncharacterized membrane protein
MVKTNHSLLSKMYNNRTELDKLLIISASFSLILVAARAIVTREILFIFLPWNLFLAAIPCFISTQLINRPAWINNKKIFGLLFVVWLLFIPNSFYILTDLFHLKLRERSSLWFDLLLIFSFAWNGLLLGILSVRQMEKIVFNCFHFRSHFVFLFPIMWLIAFGVYIGRYLRFNSWDMITDPFQLLGDIGYMLFNPSDHLYSWAMISCFAVFMTIIYLSIKRIGGSVL